MTERGGVREFRFPPDPAQVRWLREVAREAATDMGLPGLCDILALVLDELANNAIEHGGEYRSDHTDLRVRLEPRRGGIRVDFEDREMPAATVVELAALFRSGRKVSLPSIESERGRGLFLIAIHFAELAIQPGPQGGFLLRGLLAEPE